MNPFADNSASTSVGGLTLENGQDRIALYGNLDLTRDKPGLEHAKALLALLSDVVKALEADPALPAAVPPPKKAGSVKNPFG